MSNNRKNLRMLSWVWTLGIMTLTLLLVVVDVTGMVWPSIEPDYLVGIRYALWITLMAVIFLGPVVLLVLYSIVRLLFLPKADG